MPNIWLLSKVQQPMGKLQTVIPSLCFTGAVVLEGFYVYFGKDKMEVSFAKTTCPLRSPVNNASYVSAYRYRNDFPLDCKYVVATKMNLPPYAVALSVIFSFLLICAAIFTTIRLVQWSKRKHRRLQNDIDIRDLVDDSFDTGY